MNADSRSGLDILIHTWCENAETFQGFWPSRVSVMALCQLFVSERPSLQNLIVKGDIVVKPETQNGEDTSALGFYSPVFDRSCSHYDTVANEDQCAAPPSYRHI